MKITLSCFAALTLVAASGVANAENCDRYRPREGAYDNTRREARYDACVKRERERQDRRDERRTQHDRRPVDTSPNAPPPDRVVQPLQSK